MKAGFARNLVEQFLTTLVKGFSLCLVHGSRYSRYEIYLFDLEKMFLIAYRDSAFSIIHLCNILKK